MTGNQLPQESGDFSDAIAQNLETVWSRIADAARSSGREPGSVELVAVSKTFGSDYIEPAIQAGQLVFGENRVQESMAKWPELKQQYPDVELHLVGPLQTNKAKDAVSLFDCIQTLDREKLARSLANACAATGRRPRLLVQVNTGEEPQKAGILPAQTDEFIRLCIKTYKLEIGGLMCIPPIDEEPALHFSLLRNISDRNGLKDLSMGMSADYETAIGCGATMVRVGSAVFGARG